MTTFINKMEQGLDSQLRWHYTMILNICNFALLQFCQSVGKNLTKGGHWQRFLSRASEGIQYTEGRAEGILCGVMKLIRICYFPKAGSTERCSPRKILSFSPFEVVFWVILHQICVVITCNCLVATIQIQRATAIISHIARCVIAGWDEVSQNAFSYI